MAVSSLILKPHCMRHAVDVTAVYIDYHTPACYHYASVTNSPHKIVPALIILNNPYALNYPTPYTINWIYSSYTNWLCPCSQQILYWHSASGPNMGICYCLRSWITCSTSAHGLCMEVSCSKTIEYLFAVSCV